MAKRARKAGTKQAKAKRAKRKAPSVRHATGARASTRTAKRGAIRRRRATRAASRQAIDVAFKGLAIAAEPPIDRDPANLHPDFRVRLEAALSDLAAQGRPFKFVEGFRTVERQQWLFGSGRPSAVPFGRAGSVVTHRDGVTRLSNHQGNGRPGSGKGADCYPLRDGRVFIPPVSDPVWRAYANAVKRQGLKAGLDFPTLRDAPHSELV